MCHVYCDQEWSIVNVMMMGEATGSIYDCICMGARGRWLYITYLYTHTRLLQNDIRSPHEIQKYRFMPYTNKANN